MFTKLRYPRVGPQHQQALVAQLSCLRVGRSRGTGNSPRAPAGSRRDFAGVASAASGLPGFWKFGGRAEVKGYKWSQCSSTPSVRGGDWGGMRGWKGTWAAGGCGADRQVQVEDGLPLTAPEVAPFNRRWFPGTFLKTPY